MNKKPEYISWKDIFKIINPNNCSIYCSKTVYPFVVQEFSSFEITTDSPNNSAKEIILAFGGGRVIDSIKIWKYETQSKAKLFLVSSLWGSGSEVNNIAVKLENNIKKPIVSDEILADYFSIHPTIHNSLNDNIALWGYGDVYAHAFEAFLSPLSSDSLKATIANWIKNSLLTEAFTKNISWFSLSQQASVFQAQSGVGLIHGIAHELEPLVPKEYSHARLSTVFLHPVLLYNFNKSDKFKNLITNFNIDENLIFNKTSSLFNKEDYKILLPYLNEHWKKIIRNPLTRINSASVNAEAINWFNVFGDKIE